MERPKHGGIEHLRASVLDMIRDGGLMPGDRLPSEKEMAERFNVSRPTLREALKLLEMDSVIDAQQGKGRFVSAGAMLSIARPITRFESVSHLVESHGYNVETTVLGFGVVRANSEVASPLGLAANSPVLRVERLRHAKGEPLVYSIDWIPRKIVADSGLGQADWAGSIVNILSGIGQQPVASTATVSAICLPETAVALHALEGFGPALLIEETCFTANGNRVIFAQDYHRGSAFSFSFVRK